MTFAQQQNIHYGRPFNKQVTLYEVFGEQTVAKPP
jgi:hypothetical protein